MFQKQALRNIFVLVYMYTIRFYSYTILHFFVVCKGENNFCDIRQIYQNLLFLSMQIVYAPIVYRRNLLNGASNPVSATAINVEIARVPR